MGEEPDDIESWGWSEYFSELERFFADLERQYGIARGSYCDYATERLDVCELTLNRLSSVIDAGRSPEGTVLFGLRARLERLTDLVRSLRFQWHQYSATSDTRSEQSSYRAISIAGGRRGRPSFFRFRATNSIFEVTLIHLDRDSFIAWHFKNDTLQT